MAEDLLSRIGAEIDARMRELRPFVDEYEQTLEAAGALERKREVAKPPRPPARRRATAADASAAQATTGRASASARRSARAGGPARRPPARAPQERAVRGAAQQAILAALEHGSHTVGELVVVTAMSAANIRENLRRLLKAGTVTRASRDGKAAYALSR
ncbi:MAG TPA: ArsR family transcriptional regulator [Solirubrobacteraceae bacterium]|nr:ArsR family transcriptional regulator [Solirubrobacteraceae bacterium]